MVGLILIAVSAVAVGFKAAARLTARRRALSTLLLAFSEIASRIQLREERNIILSKVFSEPFTVIQGDDTTISVTCSALDKGDNDLLCEFTQKLGLGDVNSQLELCNAYGELIKKCMADAEHKERQKAGMYRTCGVLAAAALVVLLI